MASSLKFKIDNQFVNAPVGWEGLAINATFDGNNPQAIEINTDAFEFANEEAQTLINWIAGGQDGSTTGIFEGPKFSIIQEDENNSLNVFDGAVDLRDEFRIESPVSAFAKVFKGSGLTELDERAKAISYQLLYSEGLITDSDFLSVPYLTEPNRSLLETALLNLANFIMIEKLASEIRALSTDTTNVTANAASSATAAPAAAAQGVALTIIRLIYWGLLFTYIIIIANNLRKTLISPVKYHKAIKVKTLLERGFQKLGYQYNTSIQELNDLVYFPSKNSVDLNGLVDQILSDFIINQPGLGIPSAGDFGYTVSEMVELINTCCYAKVAVIDGRIEHHALISNFWTINSTFSVPDVLNEEIRYNADEHNARTLITFAQDESDIYTRQNYKGTAFEVIESAITVDNPQFQTLKGLDSVRIPVGLANRKNELNNTEKFLATLLGAIDELVEFIGFSSDQASEVTRRVGMLLFEKEMISTPRLMRLNNSNKLDANHRDKWSARYLYENFHVEKSFVGNNYAGQYRVFQDIKIPFGFSDLLKVLNNSYFTTNQGAQGKILSLQYQMDKDFAIATYRVQEIFTRNLKQTLIEP